MGEKSLTEKAIIEALQARDARRERSSLQRGHQHSPSLTPTTQVAYTKMSDMYGEPRHSPNNKDDSSPSNSHQKYTIDRTKHS